MAAHVLVGALFLVLIVVADPRGADAIGIALKAAAAAVYFGAIVLAMRLWAQGRWLVMTVPIASVAAMLLIIVIGNEVVSWTFPVGPAS